MENEISRRHRPSRVSHAVLFVARRGVCSRAQVRDAEIHDTPDEVHRNINSFFLDPSFHHGGYFFILGRIRVKGEGSVAVGTQLK